MGFAPGAAPTTSLGMVPEVGLEPTHLAVPDFESGGSRLALAVGDDAQGRRAAWTLAADLRDKIEKGAANAIDVTAIGQEHHNPEQHRRDDCAEQPGQQAAPHTGSNRRLHGSMNASLLSCTKEDSENGVFNSFLRLSRSHRKTCVS